MRALEGHPDGLHLAELAAVIGVSSDVLADEIHGYFGGGVAAGRPLRGYAEPVIEFVAPPGDGHGTDQPAAYVRLRDLRSEPEAAGPLLSLDAVTTLARSASRQLASEPGNAALRSALSQLENSVLSGGRVTGPSWLTRWVRPLRKALAERKLTHLTYVGGWRPGLSEQVIEPYQLVRTRLGWELDAAVCGQDGKLRTFLVSGIRSVTVLDESFSRPSDSWDRLARHRQPRTVELVVPHGRRDVVDLHAESAELIEEDDEVVQLRIELLPPVTLRLGLLLVSVGAEAFVVSPPTLGDAGRVLARHLLAHHRY
jgi:proteasome accessory factor C